MEAKRKKEKQARKEAKINLKDKGIKLEDPTKLTNSTTNNRVNKNKQAS